MHTKTDAGLEGPDTLFGLILDPLTVRIKCNLEKKKIKCLQRILRTITHNRSCQFKKLHTLCYISNAPDCIRE